MPWVTGLEHDYSEFDWDEDKRAINLREHQLDFQDVVPALLEPHLLAPLRVLAEILGSARKTDGLP